ncbi:Uncharacterised protein [Enterobacter cloacae]|uniref:Uncharacterized protein n=1 Tax=Enterobacter cloacae TaxID=550 RepID=A0A377M9A3_ENTCL|nr:Uncharacterised protein [Enterobacter cloacae]
MEDDEAWYRLREDGAVSIYNQGVLVRHDPAHIWGVGGLVVSKKPLALNVSRTEILRKTCPVWASIAARFGRLAATFSDNQGKHRKTEARREKTARSLLSGEGDMQSLFNGEEVITLLPGKQHVTLEHFIRKCAITPLRWIKTVSLSSVMPVMCPGENSLPVRGSHPWCIRSRFPLWLL